MDSVPPETHATLWDNMMGIAGLLTKPSWDLSAALYARISAGLCCGEPMCSHHAAVMAGIPRAANSCGECHHGHRQPLTSNAG